MFDVNRLLYSGMRVGDHLVYIGRDPQVIVELEEPMVLKKVIVEMEIKFEVSEEAVGKIQGVYNS